jgi:hypothetical protein
MTSTIEVAAQPQICAKPVEVVLLLDTSGSVAFEQPNIVAFAQQLVDRFELAGDKARFGVVRYATVSQIMLPLSDDSATVIGAVDQLPGIGTFTNMYDGMQNANDVMSGGRTGIPRVVVHLTDGLFNVGGDPRPLAEQINSNSIHLFGVDFGSNPAEVIRISNQVFPTGGLGLSQLTGIINALAGAICGATVDVPPLGTDSRGGDNRINPGKGDLEVVLYPGSDDDGNPSIEFYCVNNSTGTYVDEVTVADLQGTPTNPAQNTEVKRITVCSVLAVFYVLTSGEYQVNIGPFPDGKVYEIVFTGMVAGNIKYSEFNVNGPTP